MQAVDNQACFKSFQFIHWSRLLVILSLQGNIPSVNGVNSLGRKGGREGGMERGREGGREEGREGGREGDTEGG